MSMIVKAWFGHLNPSNCNGEYFPTKWASQASSPPRSGDACLFSDQIQWLHFHIKGEYWDMPDHWLPYHTQYPPPFTLSTILFPLFHFRRKNKYEIKRWTLECTSSLATSPMPLSTRSLDLFSWTHHHILPCSRPSFTAQIRYLIQIWVTTIQG